MPRDIYNDTIISVDSGGVPLVLMNGVLVNVYRAGTTTASTIYVDRTAPTLKANPFEAVNGVVRFWADEGEYDVAYHDPLLRISDQTIGWNSIPGGAAGITQAMMAPGVTPPVGALFEYAGASEPPGYKFCNGQPLSKTTYAALYAALGGASSPYGQDATNFNVPNLIGRSPIGAGAWVGLTTRSPGAAGGEESHALSGGEMPNHAHGVSDPTHSHGVGDPGHAHSISDPTHAHGGAAGRLWTGGGTMGTPAGTGGVAGVNITGATDFRATGIGIFPSGTGIGIAAAATGIGIGAAGGNGAHNNMHPFLALNFIIRDGT